jgi:NifB/MoaA-like Fe-S oxidoreductase
MFYASDEMIILGGRRFPPASYYDDFPQIENGVGLVRTMLDQIGGLRVPAALRGARAALVTGRLAAPYVERLARLLRRRGVPARTAAVGNRLFGPSVTVSGLLGGSDVVEALRPLREADVVVLPPDMFNCDLVTLDGMTPIEISGRLGRPVAVAGHGLQATLAGIAATLGGD